jgi:hypothetical protein
MAATVASERDVERIRGMAFGAIVAILVEAGLGMGTNLYASITRHHPGAHPGNYFAGGYDSVVWAIGNGPGELAAHAALGLALVLMTVGLVVRGIRLPGRTVGVWAVLGLLFVLGAGANGASFLNYNENISSLLMALFAFSAVFC